MLTDKRCASIKVVQVATSTEEAHRTTYRIFLCRSSSGRDIGNHCRKQNVSSSAASASTRKYLLEDARTRRRLPSRLVHWRRKRVRRPSHSGIDQAQCCTQPRLPHLPSILSQKQQNVQLKRQERGIVTTSARQCQQYELITQGSESSQVKV